MTTVIDYTRNWGGFGSARAIKAAGYEGILRYISHTPGKDLTATERDEALAAGLTIGLIFESTANRAAQGHAAGLADGLYANGRADALGYPASCTLWFAVDFDGAMSAVQPYFDGVAAAGGRPFAPYGGVNIIDGVRYSGVGWQTVAWSHNKISARAGLLQDGFHGSYDSNRVLKADYGQWDQSAPAPTPPAPPTNDEDEDMKIITPIVPEGHADHGSQWLQRGKQLLLLRGQPVDEAQQARNAGAPEGQVENPLWDDLKAASEIVLPT